MIKTRTEILEEIYDKTLAVIVDSEIQIEYMGKQDPKRVLATSPEKKYNTLTSRNEIQMVDYTAEMLLKKEESKLKENLVVLSIVDKWIKKEGSKVSEKP